MPPQAQDLREQYASMPLEALLDLHIRGDLTEIARTTLAEVLAERGITPDNLGALSLEREKERSAERIARDPDHGQLASYGSRLAARLIDMGVVVALVALFGWLTTIARSPALFFLGLIVGFAYHMLADGLPDGQSVGKRLLGIAVVDAVFGSPCTYGQSIGRNFTLYLLSFFDILFIASRRRQRLGDFAADTIVIRHHKLT